MSVKLTTLKNVDAILRRSASRRPSTITRRHCACRSSFQHKSMSITVSTWMTEFMYSPARMASQLAAMRLNFSASSLRLRTAPSKNTRIVDSHLIQRKQHTPDCLNVPSPCSTPLFSSAPRAAWCVTSSTKNGHGGSPLPAATTGLPKILSSSAAIWL